MTAERTPFLSESELANLDETLGRAHGVAKELAEIAAIEMRKGFAEGTSRWSKSDAADWVTDVDIRVEELVRERLMEEFPTHGISGEEHGSIRRSSAMRWYIDPIDGTCNYANGIPWSSFSICLTYEGMPLVGALMQPFTNELFHARKGVGAFLNDKRLNLPPDHIILPGGVVTSELSNHLYWSGMAAAMQSLQDEFVTVRIMGSSALSIVQVAAGRAIGAMLGGSSFIDVSAAILIATEAGATVRSALGDDRFGAGIGMIAAHPSVADKLWDMTFASV
ncbi:inositol monophosphatase family protein [Alicyclobacillus acidiphilus]|uniref:inositol monophosphatase family protein n=1 Tax=Alicyclobacillus acidiphilus TaxID=182455 RepID=UPI000831DC28|nr:inositol monophosphatase [Alicyclobacillus acidiphilus]